MLRIRNEQMKALAQAVRASYVDRVRARLKADFAREAERIGAGDGDLIRFVEQAIHRAGEFGVVNDQDVDVFVDCLVMLGPEFDRDPRFPWAGEILRRTDLTGTEKMSLLSDYLVFGLG